MASVRMSFSWLFPVEDEVEVEEVDAPMPLPLGGRLALSRLASVSEEFSPRNFDSILSLIIVGCFASRTIFCRSWWSSRKAIEEDGEEDNEGSGTGLIDDSS